MNTVSDSYPKEQDTKALHVAFNQDQGCFSVAHEHGFLVFNSNPIDLRVCRVFSSANGAGSGIGHITMLHRTNYLALVGGGRNPKFPNNKVIIWDDLKRRPSLSLNFMSPVLNVLLSRIRIVVVLLSQVNVYEFSAVPKKIASYETIDNIYGVADLSMQLSTMGLTKTSPSLSPPPSEGSNTSRDFAKYQILAFPGRTVGQIQLVDVSPEGQEKNSISIIKAHKSKIRLITLNRSGTMVASASETGTIIRVHSTQTTALIFEFRRGLDRAIITSMKFSPCETKLAVFSDKNTLHVYNISTAPSKTRSDPFGDGDVSLDEPLNRQHVLNKLKLPIPLLNYFQSTWSFCSVNTNQYHPEMDINDEATIGWSGNDTVIVIWKRRKIWESYSIIENPKFDAIGGTRSIHTPRFILSRSSWMRLTW